MLYFVHCEEQVDKKCEYASNNCKGVLPNHLTIALCPSVIVYSLSCRYLGPNALLHCFKAVQNGAGARSYTSLVPN